MTTHAPPRPVGSLLREWRERRRLSQLDLALQAEVSTRHLSYLETGRSRPTAQMILRLSEHLDVPLRERNQLLLAGGFAPAYPENAVDSPEVAQVMSALRAVLDGHAPCPAVVVDRWWDLVDANSAVTPLLDRCAPHLLEPPVNVLRMTLHPEGVAPRIRNLPQWRSHLLEQLLHRARALQDDRLLALHEELSALPGGSDPAPPRGQVVVPLVLEHDGQVLSLFSIASVVRTATDVTVSELVVETFYPSDEATGAWLRAQA
ncbi:helix-turn-helix domain-containing protein [Nocardioides marmoribigeumensis]|uniref:Transcriptional regulator with XRE-family HTH domain n=1 Tax=Nocardioides marmoribigeumensis TaxID=433649 RepID=A0ABU2BUZ5_9ACTN|nr:helix-turn-helix transcriptional regulator [Nocardioides marmoribigeumensis]MDR7361844.1 transcriptional regulator with XRE-family HTH domain [Nocardioides marmoribigeumensis]